jgi:hypothetical protein
MSGRILAGYIDAGHARVKVDYSHVRSSIAASVNRYIDQGAEPEEDL